MTPFGKASLAVVVLSLPSGSVAADSRTRPGRFKIGPLYLTPKLELKNAGVDTNVFNTRSGQIPDTAVALSPTLDGALPVGRRLRITGDGHVDFNIYRRQASERSTDFGGQGQAELDLGPATLFGGGGGGQYRQRFSIELDQRVLRQEKTANAGLRLDLSNKLSTTVRGTGQVYTFESLLIGGEDIKAAFDRNTLTGTVQLRYAITRKTTLVLSGDAIEDRFLSQRSDAPRRVRSYRYLGGFELGERALISGSVLAGIREFPGTDSRGAPAYRGPALSVKATLPFHSARISGTADRDVLYAVGRARTREDTLRNTYVSSRYHGEVAVGLPLDLMARGFGGYEEARFILPYLRENDLARRVDHLWTAGGSLLRRLGEGVWIGGTVGWARRVSNFPGFSYEGLRYGLQAEVAP